MKEWILFFCVVNLQPSNWRKQWDLPSTCKYLQIPNFNSQFLKNKQKKKIQQLELLTTAVLKYPTCFSRISKTGSDLSSLSLRDSLVSFSTSHPFGHLVTLAIPGSSKPGASRE